MGVMVMSAPILVPGQTGFAAALLRMNGFVATMVMAFVVLVASPGWVSSVVEPPPTYDAASLTYDERVEVVPRSDAVPAVSTTFIGTAQGTTAVAPDAVAHVYDPPHSFVAPNTTRPAVGLAPGEGVAALTRGRLQHGTAHLTDAGVLPAWSGRNSPKLIRDTLSPILERPTATFNSTLGQTKVKGFIGTVDGQTVAVQVYAEGPLAGQLATSIIPTQNQLTKWGVAP